MLYAIGQGDDKLPAAPGLHAICPVCGGEVLAKCGKIVSWHWAHVSGKDCDDWYEPETEWHLRWKKLFPKEYVEVTINRKGKRHHADVCLPD